MRSAFILSFLAVAVFNPPGIGQAPGPATVEGVVFRSGTRTPVSGARVELVSASPGGGVRIVTGTDAAGRFGFSDVVPDTYRLGVSRDGYVAGAFGAERAGDSGTAFPVGPGQRITDVGVGLTPTGSISGFVQGLSGEPVVEAQVSAMETSFDGAVRILSPVRSATTNDRGEYRLYWLEPGPYVVRVTPKPGAPLDPSEQIVTPIDGRRGGAGFGSIPGLETGTPRSYAPTYYPGTTDPSGGAVIDLGPGIEYAGIGLRVAPVLAATVRGRVVSGGEPVSRLSVRLIPREEGFGIRPWTEPVARTDENGAFSISGVVPGPYRIFVRDGGAFRPGADAVPAAYGRVDINVGAGDIDNVVVALVPGFTLRGRVSLGPGFRTTEGISAPGVTVSADRIRYGVGVGSARVDRDGAFEIRGLPPNDYQIAVNGFGDGSYIRDAMIGSEPALDPVLRLDSQPAAPLLIEVANDAGRVSVSVQDASGAPASGVRVALVPDAPLRARRTLFRDQLSVAGAAMFENVVPGSYKLFAWEQVPEGAWTNADFIRAYETMGEAVEVGGGQAVSAMVRVIQ